MVSGEWKFDMGFVVEQWRSRQRQGSKTRPISVAESYPSGD